MYGVTDLLHCWQESGCAMLAVHGRQRGKPGDKHKYPADLSAGGPKREYCTSPWQQTSYKTCMYFVCTYNKEVFWALSSRRLN